MTELSAPTIIAFVIYVGIVLAIGVYAYLSTKSATDYFLGGRNLSPAVSAISAGASDMSGWVLLGLPGYAYMAGLEAFWITLGLTIGVAANWMLMAKRLRIYTVILDDAVTIPAYLQRRFGDAKPWLKIIASVSILLFFLFYVGSGLIAGGKLFNAVFGLDYVVAVLTGVVLILFYTLFGGFLAVSWTDVFQGLLMLAALIAVPVVVMSGAGGLGGFGDQVRAINPELLDIFTNASGESLSTLQIISLLGWGFGYFGLPHVLARFKAIRSADEVGVATVIGVSWSFVGYLMAILVGLCGVVYLANPLADSERVFIELTSVIFHPLVAGVLLAAILAAIMSTVDSQLLVCSSTLAEDLYPMLAKQPLTQEARLKIGRIAVVAMALMATVLAMKPDSKVLDVVSYAWAGLGASLGPSILLSLYWRSMTAAGALAGVVTGGATVIIWESLSGGLFELYSLVPGFALSLTAIAAVSWISVKPNAVVQKQFDQMRIQL
ncbi:MAG: sodium/proline symporter PutP [Porticoccaceae bacterium]|jgi:sodium/proline symporter|nr:sodium/proline symporter PutP [Porticoccaceae bacterium]